MGNIGFKWEFSPGNCRSQRTPGSCASVYTPIEEKHGFWANSGKPFVYALVCFGVCLFVLIYGWNNGLAVGGVPYYTFAIMSVLLWGCYSVHIVRQHHVLARAARCDDDEAAVHTVTAGVPVEIKTQVPAAVPGDSVRLVYGLWGETEQHTAEMEHLGGDRFLGRMDVAGLLHHLRQGVLHYRVDHRGRGQDAEQPTECLIVRLATDAQ